MQSMDAEEGEMHMKKMEKRNLKATFWDGFFLDSTK